MANAPTTQTSRLLKVSTPLGPDVLLATALSAREEVSHLFRFRLDAVAEVKKDVPFDKLLGQPVKVALELPDKKVRYFAGIVSRCSQGQSDTFFCEYRLEIVPKFWLLTKKVQSRIFQHQSVPDVLKKVLQGLDVEYQIQGAFQPRDYCVQYRESDFAFASRLMEEEGIFYFFKHSDAGDKLVVANTPQAHPAVPGSSTVTYKSVPQDDQSGDVVTSMEKTQEVASSKFTLWDHTFELPHRHNEVQKPIQDSAAVGKVTHKLKPPAELEVYDWPGGYAGRFDGIDKGGGEQKSELDKIETDGKRVVEIRAQHEAAARIGVRGGSRCRQFTAGHKVSVKTLSTDPVAVPLKIDGDYVLTAVEHLARIGSNLRSGEAAELYDNTFSALPAAVPFRPARTTPKPVVPGCQTAVVVGPPAEEIFTDKYGRVKVQFHWDREGKQDADSSCWVRVATGSAGRGWGMLAVPRIGQEVVVDFLEGDPDQPIITGCVYNPDQMPAYKLPDEKTKSYWKSDTSPGGVGFNEIRFEDKKDKEQIFIHAERNMDERVKHDRMERVIHDRHLIVGWEKDGNKGGSQYEEVLENKHLKVHKDQEEHVGGNIKLHVGGVDDGKGNVDVRIDGKKTETIGDECHVHVKTHWMQKVGEDYELTAKNRFTMMQDSDQLHVKGQRAVKVDDKDSLTVGGDRHQKITGGYATDAGTIHLKAGQTVVIEAGVQLTLKVGGNFIDISPAGVAIQGTMVLINSGGAPGTGTGASPAAPSDPDPPDDAAEAKPTKPTQADDSKTGKKSCP
jgi:type VI secretion system secreted protein VgrG